MNEVFVGSSQEGRPQAALVVDILNKLGLNALPWWDPDCFPTGEITFVAIENIARRVIGAVFLATPDDPASLRNTPVMMARANVLFEYGYFTAILSRAQVALCRYDGVVLPSDLGGLTYISMGPFESSGSRFPDEAVRRLRQWASSLPTGVSLSAPGSIVGPYAVYPQRVQVNWTDFNSSVEKRFWVCGTSLNSLFHRRPGPLDLFRDAQIKVLLPAAEVGTSSFAQLNDFNRFSNPPMPDQIAEARHCVASAQKIISELAPRTNLPELRCYRGIMYSNITIMDEDAFIAFYDSTGIGVNNVTLHVKLSNNPFGYAQIETEFDRMWEANVAHPQVGVL
jgi:hypothetical protein